MESFEKSVKDVNLLLVAPTNEEKLSVYSLFKQSTVGNVNIPQPYFYDIAGRSKWDAWNAQKDKTQIQAKREYINFVNMLIVKYGIQNDCLI